MFWKKKEKPPFPKEYLQDYLEYYIVSRSDLEGLDKIRVKYQGTVNSKPVITYYGTALPWDLESTMERDHGHSTTFTVDDLNISMKGPVFVKEGEEITIWGVYRQGSISAVQLEAPHYVFRT